MLEDGCSPSLPSQTEANANPKAIATQLKSTIKEKPNPEEFRTLIAFDPLCALSELPYLEMRKPSHFE